MRRGLRTRSRKRKTIKTPGAMTKLHFVEKKPARPRCRFCGGEIAGVRSERSAAHSERTVERVYGGEVCHRCLEKSLISDVVSEWKF